MDDEAIASGRKSPERAKPLRESRTTTMIAPARCCVGSVDGRLRGRKKVRTLCQLDLPKEDIKIVLRPRDGLNVSRISQALLKDGILRDAALRAEETTEGTFGTNNFKNIIVASTPSMERAAMYNRITELSIGRQTHEITTYVTPPEDCTKGVIHNIPVEESDDDITQNLVYTTNQRSSKQDGWGKKLSRHSFQG
ncbi:hypothetical protein HPB48_000162 [Haemaphysalis longicornis]|uniref:Uncharacterized protein n=1 Tax=Haemaphysalis longicornis TaxID=44386 RepID=A0A9J6FQ90_HAELO|nr:hypothetical protein HPB48_000162 [Haemaphysalis longicornis]